MLEAEVDDLQAELAATQAVAAKHQRTAAATGQEIKVLQRLSSSGDISFMRTHSQTGRRSTTGHRYSEQGIPAFGSHDDLVHLQACGHVLSISEICFDCLSFAAEHISGTCAMVDTPRFAQESVMLLLFFSSLFSQVTLPCICLLGFQSVNVAVLTQCFGTLDM